MHARKGGHHSDTTVALVGVTTRYNVHYSLQSFHVGNLPLHIHWMPSSIRQPRQRRGRVIFSVSDLQGFRLVYPPPNPWCRFFPAAAILCRAQDPLPPHPRSMKAAQGTWADAPTPDLNIRSPIDGLGERLRRPPGRQGEEATLRNRGAALFGKKRRAAAAAGHASDSRAAPQTARGVDADG
jgi:hypothetical protein